MYEPFICTDTVDFFVDGSKYGSAVNTDKMFLDVEWNDLRYIFLGSDYDSGWNAWSERASVEFYDISMSEIVAKRHYTNALDMFKDNC